MAQTIDSIPFDLGGDSYEIRVEVEGASVYVNPCKDGTRILPYTISVDYDTAFDYQKVRGEDPIAALVKLAKSEIRRVRS